MKLKFKVQAFQTAAVTAVVDLFRGQKWRQDTFTYDSKKLSAVRLFATSGDIEIMIINIDAFKKSENIINQAQDRLNGDAAISLVQSTRPIVIIDEPQSVDNTPKAKEAIASLNPLCVFRYSATHREKINLLYRLTPVDAYQMGLVKQICVSSNQIENMDRDGAEKLYFVLETKGVSGQLGLEELATAQRQKIVCGERHFEALESGVLFAGAPVREWREVKVGL